MRVIDMSHQLLSYSGGLADSKAHSGPNDQKTKKENKEGQTVTHRKDPIQPGKTLLQHLDRINPILDGGIRQEAAKETKYSLQKLTEEAKHQDSPPSQ